MSHASRRTSPLRARVLLGALLLCSGFGSAQAESLHAPWYEQEQGRLLEQQLAALAEEPRSHQLLLTADPDQLRSTLQQLCPASAAHCEAAAPLLAAGQRGLAPAELDLLLQRLASRLQSNPSRLPLQLQGRADDPRGQPRPVASL